MANRFFKRASAGAILLFLWPLAAWAHVKWFTQGTYADKPLSVNDILTPDFWVLFAGTLIVTMLGVVLDDMLTTRPWYRRIDEKLGSVRSSAPLIMRVTVAMVLILSWQADSMLVPNVVIKHAWLGWYQFVLAFLIIIPRTYPIGGVGLIVLYLIGHLEFSSFHMLDYLVFLGVGWYLAVDRSSNAKLRKTGLMMLYLTLGFSLCWVAIEKFIYPEWAYSILDQNPRLTMGLKQEFFLRSAAFIEFGLGYLLITNMLNRPLAVIITLVFFLTTTVFGKTEVIGHTLLHGSLIVFLIEGRSPIYNRIKRHMPSLWARSAITALGFIILFPLLLYPYSRLADIKYAHRAVKVSADHGHMHMPVEIPDSLARPEIAMSVFRDSISGYNLRFKTEHFLFAPDHAGLENRFNEGHAHLYLDGEKIARVYGEWYHVPDLRPGEHEFVVTLHANRHNLLTYQGQAIADTALVIAPRLEPITKRKVD